MRKLTQKFRHNPNDGIFGDCFRTCLACLFDYEKPEYVPHFLHDDCDADTFWERVQRWLKPRKLIAINIPFTGTIEDVLLFMEDRSPELHYILSGTGNKDTDHAVIARGGTIIHDPSIDQYPQSLTGPAEDGYVYVTFLSILT